MVSHIFWIIGTDFTTLNRWFNSEDMHGTLMPRASSIEAAVSDGVQVTLRSKAFKSASKLKAIRCQYQNPNVDS